MTNYEIINIATNVGLLIIGGIGLNHLSIGMKQIKLTKDDMFIRNQRESITLTANLCEKFPEIIKRTSDINMILVNEKTKPLIDNIKEHKYPLDKEKLCRGYLLQNKNMIEYILLIQNKSQVQRVRNLLNELEAFAIYFNSSVADSQIGYITIGRGFCGIIENYLPVIMYSRCEGCNTCENSKSNIYYDNLLNVYISWKSRIELEHDNQEFDKFLKRNNDLVKKAKFDVPLGLK